MNHDDRVGHVLLPTAARCAKSPAPAMDSAVQHDETSRHRVRITGVVLRCPPAVCMIGLKGARGPGRTGLYGLMGGIDATIRGRWTGPVPCDGGRLGLVGADADRSYP